MNPLFFSMVCDLCDGVSVPQPPIKLQANFIPTGFPSLDKLVGGLPKNQLTLVHGGQGSGKTYFAARVAVRNLDLGRTVMYCSPNYRDYQGLDDNLKAFNKFRHGVACDVVIFDGLHGPELADALSYLFNVFYTGKSRSFTVLFCVGPREFNKQLKCMSYLTLSLNASTSTGYQASVTKSNHSPQFVQPNSSVYLF